jgi:iron complex outermembrane receptor protein
MLGACAAFVLLALGPRSAPAQDSGQSSRTQQTLSPQDLAEMSLEDLSKVEVTSVSRRPEPLASAAASVFVITDQDIRRSGATTLPEALRLAPNLEVGRINNALYGISARGFNLNIANKLLVMIDGRTIYSPLFSGVFWDTWDIPLEDIDRIEVIDGPGAATWGINAVNGVINIITRSAARTQNALVSAGAGDEERFVTAQYGGRLGARGYYRVYGRSSTLEPTELEAGGLAADGWDRRRMGFRADFETGVDSFTLDAAVYDAASDTRPTFGAVDLSGGHLLGHWRRQSGDRAFTEITTYYDETDRSDLRLLQENAAIVDVDLQHGLVRGRHSLVVGGGYRHARSESERGLLFAFVPPTERLDWYNVFGQDQIRVGEAGRVTLGLRAEHNDYTGWETMPSVRYAWAPNARRLFWAALSRAVRAPARLDREIFTPAMGPCFICGGPDFDAEIADVAEVGYRATPASQLSFSVTVFQHWYDRLRSAQFTPLGTIVIANLIEGEVSGVTGWGNWQVLPDWRLSFGGMVLHEDLRLKPGSNDPIGPSNLGNDPDYQALLRSTFDISSAWQLDATLRHVAELPAPAVPAYTALDLRLGWRPNVRLNISLTLRDLLDGGHVEFHTQQERSVFEPSALLQLVWRQ